jgi:NAD(P)-dependent dehydrogenase (short-subunit alcohol dehydrogenase family)
MATPATRHYLITGAARGIGRGLSRLLLQRGHRVFLLDNNEDELKNTITLLSKTYRFGTDYDSCICNIRKPQDITEAVEKASRLFGGHLDCLVNNAASKYSRRMRSPISS